MINLGSRDEADRLGAYLLSDLIHAVAWPKFTRNNYCCEVDSHDARCWQLLVGLGMAKEGPKINEGRDQYFHVTPAGLEMLRAFPGPQP